ncbi:PIN domain-containing protein [Pelomonas sp. Root1217]|uniref:PIN domain-containing protein n=1 Tax=Pelomonas sp. Root1217 TaxID=1736430 RepID=UPI000A9ABEF4|nr:PIN domain-containing protein [Pelomonas sp. Root1217]
MRYLVQDDAAQAAAVRQLLARLTGEGATLFVPVTVVLLQALSSLFSAAELSIESERALEVALQLLRQGPADFADCLHIALAAQAGEQPLWTFDKGAARVNGAQLLVKS